MTVEHLRKLIREEIGRNFKQGESQDAYPWHTPDADISIAWDPDQEKYIAQVTLSDGTGVQKALNDEVEAQHWASTFVDKQRRKGFANVK